MQTQYPNAYRYLARFRGALEERGGWEVRNLMEAGPFYSMSEVGDYTFAPYKLVWKEQGSWLQCAVIGPADGRPVIPDHKLMMVPFEDPEPAYFICALLNSSPAQLAAWAYVISIQQGTHIMRYLNVPAYDSSDPNHRDLARLGRSAHQQDADTVRETEAAIDDAASRLWELTLDEEREIERNLSELTD